MRMYLAVSEKRASMWSQTLLIITCGEKDTKIVKPKPFGRVIFNCYVLHEKFNMTYYNACLSINICVLFIFFSELFF